MRNVARHYVDTDFAEVRAGELAEEIPAFVDLAKRKPSALRAVMELSLDEAGLRCVNDQEAAWTETWDAVVRALQAGSAVFAVAGQAEVDAAGEVEFRLGDDVVRVPPVGPTMQNDAITWLNALYLAMIARDKTRIDLLASVPIDLLRASGLEHDDYVYAAVRMWQAYWRGEDGVVRLVLAAMAAADPETAANSSPTAVLQVHFPIIEVLFRFLDRDEGKFNEALATALEQYREFWTKDDESAVSPRGFIALGLLAVACHAKDLGLSIDVASEYLPECLLDGNRVGERVI